MTLPNAPPMPTTGRGVSVFAAPDLKTVAILEKNGEAMAKIIKDAVPISYQAFEDYQLYAMSFSRLELDILSKNQWPMSKEKVAGAVSVIANKTEREEFL